MRSQDPMTTRSRAEFIVNYHTVRPRESSPFPGLIGISPEDFRAQVAALAAEYDFTAVSEIADNRPSSGRPRIALAFDDGFTDVIEFVYPILQEFKATATIYLPTLPQAEGRVISTQKRQILWGTMGKTAFRSAFYELLQGKDFVRDDFESLGIVGAYRADTPEDRLFKLDLNYAIPYAVLDPILDKMFVEIVGSELDVTKRLYMSVDDIKRLIDSGWEIGGHGYRHRVMSRLSPQEQREDIVTNCGHLRDLLGIKANSFAYPFGAKGSYNANTVEALRAAGYSNAVTGRPGLLRDLDKEEPFAIPRFDNQDLFDKSNTLRRHLVENGTASA